MSQQNSEITKMQMEENQIKEKIIQHIKGPMQVIAGPGTGKTKVLIDHVAYLIQEKNVEPNAIMIVTYTRKAARELLTRLTDKLNSYEPGSNGRRNTGKKQYDLSGMYIGTFHHICSMLQQKYGGQSYLNLSPDIESTYDYNANPEQQSSKRFLDEFE